VDFVYRNVRACLGPEARGEALVPEIRPYQISAQPLALARPDVARLHCIPARHGRAITGEAGSQYLAHSADRAETKWHVRRAIRALLMGPWWRRGREPPRARRTWNEA